MLKLNFIGFFIFCFFLGCIPLSLQSQTVNNAVSQVLSLDKGWRFHKGDIPFPAIKGHGMSYENAKAGRAWGAAAPSFDDMKWRMIDLPHDWAIEGVPQKDDNIAQGYRERGYGWYRRQFKLDSTVRGKHIELRFDGIATFATIWLNGTLVHRNWCGYTSMYIDATPFLKYGEELNTLAIRVDAESQEGWWYEGAGIYRHTYMVIREPLHIQTDGVFANPVKQDNSSLWKIPVEVSLLNTGKTKGEASVEVQLLSPEGKLIKSATKTLSIPVLGEGVAKMDLELANPRLWDIEDPVLYSVKTLLSQNGKLVDSVSQHCGFRSIHFDADSGFYLNGRHVKLQGVCNHQDHAGVGVAIPDALWEFRMRKLKELGVNAYRCSHNPPSKELLDLTDRLGILVMDENRNFNSSPEYIRQLQWLVRRDRSRPSVFMWSVFNEEPMQGTEMGYEMVRRMSHVVKELDVTRPVTAAMNGGLFDPINVSQAVDVFGFNYQHWAYDRFQRENPKLPKTSSEDISAFMVRGEYKTDLSRHIMNSYDDHAADWGKTHRAGWKEIDTRKWLAGGFVWTGFDYHGEPTPFAWPTNSSLFGIMDLCGFPKAAFYMHQAQWVKDKPVLALIPHWSWPDSLIGKPIKVMAMTNAPLLRLYLNDKLIGEQRRNIYEMNTWSVPYNPGKLTLIALDESHKEIARTSVETTGEPVSLELVPDRMNIKADGVDAIPITVRALDKKGRAVPIAQHMISFSVKGAGRIIGLGNGDPNSLEPEKGTQRHLFNGLAQVIVQHNDSVGERELIIRAENPSLKAAILRIPVKTSVVAPSVPVVLPAFIIDQWRVSRVYETEPVVSVRIADNDMNSWENTKTGQYIKVESGQYIQLRAEFVPHDMYTANGGRIMLARLLGATKAYLDGVLVPLEQTSKGDRYIKLPKGKQKHSLVIVFQSGEGRVGIGGSVTLVE